MIVKDQEVETDTIVTIITFWLVFWHILYIFLLNYAPLSFFKMGICLTKKATISIIQFNLKLAPILIILYFEIIGAVAKK